MPFSKRPPSFNGDEMLLYQLDQLDESKLQFVCDDLTSETLTLEFKRELPSKEGKLEFLKDVAAFANAEGGDLIYGIEEKSGTALRIHPIEVSSTDAEQRRVGQYLDGGVEPRITGIRFKEVSVKGGFVLMLRIPRSYDGPHRVIHNNDDGKFFLRSGTHISNMSYDQLKTAFDRTATLAERAKAFRRERLDAIHLGKTPSQVIPGPLCAVHIIPLVSLTGRQLIDVASLYRDSANRCLMAFDKWNHNKCTLNLDGIVNHCASGNFGYNQIYRTGCTESVFAAGSENTILAKNITEHIRMVIDKNLKFLKQSGISGPAIVGVAVLNIKSHKFFINQLSNFIQDQISPLMADRDSLILPEVWLESLDTMTDIDEVVRPLMDILWQSFGVERCLQYNNTGIWYPNGL